MATISYGIEKRRCRNTFYVAFRRNNATEETWWTEPFGKDRVELAKMDPKTVFTSWWDEGRFNVWDEPTCPLIRGEGGATVEEDDSDEWEEVTEDYVEEDVPEPEPFTEEGGVDYSHDMPTSEYGHLPVGYGEPPTLLPKPTPIREFEEL
jgi:hypothetical protein